jgi:hypothetical protein
MPRKCKLTDAQKAYVVRRLAAYESPTAIARDLERDFGVTIGHQAVGRYNPALGSRLAQRWKDLFAQARAAHRAATAKAGVTGKAAAIRARERMALAAWGAGRFKHASDILDAIAKEVGNPFNDKDEP